MTQRLILEHGSDPVLRKQAETDYPSVVKVFEEWYQGCPEKGIAGMKHTEKALLTREQLLALKACCPGGFGIVTGRPRKDAQEAIERYNWQGVFDAVVTMDDGPLKPNAFPMLLCMQQLAAAVKLGGGAVVPEGVQLQPVVTAADVAAAFSVASGLTKEGAGAVAPVLAVSPSAATGAAAGAGAVASAAAGAGGEVWPSLHMLERTIMLGDTVDDIRAAVSAGMRGEWGQEKRERRRRENSSRACLCICAGGCPLTSYVISATLLPCFLPSLPSFPCPSLVSPLQALVSSLLISCVWQARQRSWQPISSRQAPVQSCSQGAESSLPC